MSALFQQIWATMQVVFKTDAATMLLPPIAKFFNSIAGNPTALNIAVAAAQLNVEVMAALPTIGQDELKAIATLINNAVQAAATPPKA